MRRRKIIAFRPKFLPLLPFEPHLPYFIKPAIMHPTKKGVANDHAFQVFLWQNFFGHTLNMVC